MLIIRLFEVKIFDGNIKIKRKGVVLVTQKMINNTAQKLQNNISRIETYLEKSIKPVSLDTKEALLEIRDDARYFLVFLESSTRNKKVENLSFEKDLNPIVILCDAIENILNSLEK